MTELPATWARTLKIWWALLWRFTILSALGGVGMSFLMSMIVGIFGLNPYAIDRSRWLQLTFTVLGATLALVVLRWVLALAWSDFRIALVHQAQADAAADGKAEPRANV